MQQVTGAESNGDIFKVTPELEPRSREEGIERACYFMSALGIACADAVTAHLRQCRSGTFGDGLSEAATRQISEREFVSAIKELTCVSIYIALLDQGGEAAPTWLTRFLFTGLMVTDKLSGGPRAREIMQMHEFVPGIDAICRDASVNACRSLGLGSNAEAAAVPLEHFLKDSRSYRAQLLENALTRPLDWLHKHIEEMK